MENPSLKPSRRSNTQRRIGLAAATIITMMPPAALVTHSTLDRPEPDCGRLLRRVRFTYASARQTAHAHLACLNGGDCDNGGLALVDMEEAQAEKAWKAYERSCPPVRKGRP
jgi:hypothetical protein